MTRGSLYWINLGASSPPEFGKTRPGLVVSNTAHNEALDSVVAVPLSTVQGEFWPLRISAGSVRGKPSFAVLPGIRQVSKSRLADYIGTATTTLMERMDRALSLYLGD